MKIKWYITPTYICTYNIPTLTSQDDWAGWIDFTSGVKDKVQTVGDDLTVTNIKRIKKAADEGACNALLLKVRCCTRAPRLIMHCRPRIPTRPGRMYAACRF